VWVWIKVVEMFCGVIVGVFRGIIIGKNAIYEMVVWINII